MDVWFIYVYMPIVFYTQIVYEPTYHWGRPFLLESHVFVG